MTLRAICLAAALLAAPAAAQPGFDRAAWKADYERLKGALAQGYANLDWQVEKRGINLSRADGQIGAMLDSTNSDAEAVLVFTRILEAFDDPHLDLRPGPAPDGAKRLPTTSAVAPALPAACGEEPAKGATRLPYTAAVGWTPVAGAPFASGMVGTTGFIRIPSFDEGDYAELCKAGGADDDAVRMARRAMLTRAFEQRIAALRARGMTRLVVDVARNGGGSEWASDMAARLASGPLTRMQPRLADPKCDRSGIWRGDKVCSIYGKAETETIRGTGAWTGPVAVLVDRRTASAAEEFAVWLKDNGRAAIVGEKTAGAGCGYIDGGAAFQFRAANIHLMIPNCSRFRRDGTNEIEGIVPDVPAAWSSLDGAGAMRAIAASF